MPGDLIARLTQWGIVRPVEVVELATAAGLDIAAACAMLTMESGGGRNVWGADRVQTGGIYVPGSEVTERAYRAYRARRSELGNQGVGPCQLTYGPLQDAADRRGGCWDWRANCSVGFEHLSGLQRTYGVRDGFRRYNGSGPAAEAYADKSMSLLVRWRDRIGDATAAIGAAALPELRYGTKGSEDVAHLQAFAARFAPGYPGIGKLPITGNYLDQTRAWVREFQERSRITGADANGETVGPRTNAALWAAGYRG